MELLNLHLLNTSSNNNNSSKQLQRHVGWSAHKSAVRMEVLHQSTCSSRIGYSFWFPWNPCMKRDVPSLSTGLHGISAVTHRSIETPTRNLIMTSEPPSPWIRQPGLEVTILFHSIQNRDLAYRLTGFDGWRLIPLCSFPRCGWRLPIFIPAWSVCLGQGLSELWHTSFLNGAGGLR